MHQFKLQRKEQVYRSCRLLGNIEQIMLLQEGDAMIQKDFNRHYNMWRRESIDA